MYEDWDYKEWPYQLKVRAKSKKELIEMVGLHLDCIKSGEADIIVGFDKDLIGKMKILRKKCTEKKRQQKT
jgi:hypothetical protein